MCVSYYFDFLSIGISQTDIQLSYLKPRPEVIIPIENLESYEIRHTSFILHEKEGRSYHSVAIGENSLDEIKGVVNEVEKRAPWVKELHMAEWRKTKWGKYFWWWD